MVYPNPLVDDDFNYFPHEMAKTWGSLTNKPILGSVIVDPQGVAGGRVFFAASINHKELLPREIIVIFWRKRMR